MSKPFQDINADTAAAKRGVVPDHFVNNYGPSTNAPDASRFNKGTSTTEGAAQAAAARRAIVPGNYDRTK